MKLSCLVSIAILLGLSACASTPAPTAALAPTVSPSHTPTAMPTHTPALTNTSTATATRTPTSTSTASPTVSAQVLGVLKPGEIVKHPSTSQTTYTWFSYFPKSAVGKQTLTVCSWPTGGGNSSSDYAYHESQAEKVLNGYRAYAEQYQLPLIIVAIPRTRELYINSLHLGTFTTTLEFHRRPDLKFFDAIWNQYIPSLRAVGLDVDEHVLLFGFSVPATFSYRFAIMNPEKVRAMWLGSFTPAPLPVAELNGQPLDYPLGVRNLETLTGKPFDLETFKKIPNMIVVGENDTLFANDNLCCNDIFTEPQKAFVRENLGDTNPKRMKAFNQFLVSVGVSSQFKQYPGLGHQMSSTMTHEAFRFLLANTRETIRTPTPTK